MRATYSVRPPQTSSPGWRLSRVAGKVDDAPLPRQRLPSPRSGSTLDGMSTVGMVTTRGVEGSSEACDGGSPVPGGQCTDTPT